MSSYDEINDELKRVKAHEDDWAARFQDASTQMWELLASGRQPRDNPALTLFGNLLLKPTYFELAQLVIPDLRQAGEPPAACSSLQRELLELVRPLRERRADRLEDAPSRHADPFYADERATLRDSLLHQLAVLLTGDGRLSREQKKELDAWLAQCPL